ncbi:MAG: hypothetical protein JWN33_100 [Candidatus Saccharibacteria bacterium]|nr:hypothetical protein [Candidatus Saccharibacteria bacterium]
MIQPSNIVIDKIKWIVYQTSPGVRETQPLCPQHYLRLRPSPDQIYSQVSHKYISRPDSTATQLQCAEGPHFLDIKRKYSEEKLYVIDRLDALTFEKATYIYLDDKAIPLATDEHKGKDSPVWVKAKVTESKSGLRLIVWAGDRSKKSKAQLFIEPEIQRMSFDQNDDHPLKVFAKVDALFAGGVKAQIRKG